ncbi:MAG: DMT family transporter [Sporomusaceae bacterium]|nr:DMT family transporter [Sporomusaceae bacterium]
MKSNYKEKKGYLLIFIAGLLWGCIGLFIQAMENCGSTSPITSFLRVSFSFVILAVVTSVKFGVSSFRVNKRTLFACALLGLVCHGIYNIFYSVAVLRAGVTISAVFLNTAPIFTAIFACFLFKETITTMKIIALVINIFGCVLATTGGSLNMNSFSIVGSLCGIGAGICYSLTAILGKFAGEKSNAFVISTYSYMFATIFLAFFSRSFDVKILLSEEILILGFLYALIPTAIAYLFYYQGVQLITESSKVPVIASVETIIAAIIGTIVFREPLDIVSMIGIIFVMISIAFNEFQITSGGRYVEEIKKRIKVVS